MTDFVKSWLDTLPAYCWPDAKTRLTELATLVAKGRVQFLCGAGMSKGSGAPLAKDLSAKMICEMLTGAAPDGFPSETHVTLAERFSLDVVAEAYPEELDHPRLRELIGRELAHVEGKHHAGHDALAYLADHGYIDQVYTTNFDDLLLEALGERAKPVTDAQADSVPEIKQRNQIPILHIHGRVGSQCLLAESDTCSLDTPLATLMMADMVTGWFVWVGYQLGDLDLRAMYLSMRAMLRREGLAKTPYVVLKLSSKKDADKKEEWRLANMVWKARKAKFVPGDAECFLPALVLQVRRIDADRWAKAIIDRKGGDPADVAEFNEVWKEARGIASETGLGDDVDGMKALARQHGVDLEAQ